jgi:hypothetical protein
MIDDALKGDESSALLLKFFLSEEFAELTLREQDSWIDNLVDALKDRRISSKSIRVGFNPGSASWCVIRDLLSKANEKGKEHRVAQYLVGAKLALRFPHLTVENFSFSSADAQLSRP